MERLVAKESYRKAAYDKAASEHPLEAEALELKLRRRRYEANERQNNPKYHALVRERSLRYKRKKQKLSTAEEPDDSIPDAHTMQALLDDMDAAQLW